MKKTDSITDFLLWDGFSFSLWEAVNTLYALIVKISHYMSILENL